MATRYVPAVPGPESSSRKVRKRVQEAQQQLNQVEAKLKRGTDATRSSKRAQTS